MVVFTLHRLYNSFTDCMTSSVFKVYIIGFSIGDIVCAREVLIIRAFGGKGATVDAIVVLKIGI